MGTVVCMLKACTYTSNNSDSKVANLSHDKNCLSFATEHFPGPHSKNVIIELACNESGPWTTVDKLMLAGGVVTSFNIKCIRLSCDGSSPSPNKVEDSKMPALYSYMWPSVLAWLLAEVWYMHIKIIYNKKTFPYLPILIFFAPLPEPQVCFRPTQSKTNLADSYNNYLYNNLRCLMAHQHCHNLGYLFQEQVIYKQIWHVKNDLRLTSSTYRNNVDVDAFDKH